MFCSGHETNYNKQPLYLTKACLLSLFYHFLISARTSNRLWVYKGGECTESLCWIHTAILYCKNVTLKPFSHSFSPDEGPWTNRASVTAICTSAWSTDGPIVLCNKGVVWYCTARSVQTWPGQRPLVIQLLSLRWLCLYLPIREWLLCSSVPVQLVAVTLRLKSDLKMLI